MASPFETNGQCISLVAVDAQTSSRYLFVDVDGNGKCDVAGTAGQQCIGVLKNTPAADEAATIQIDGVCRVIASEAINEGDIVSTTNAGRAQVADTAGWYILGTALTAAGANGDVISVLLKPAGIVPA